MNLRLDPSPLPPLLLTSDEGSFAQSTLRVRIPRILRETIERNAFPTHIVDRLQALHEEVTTGRIRALVEEAPDAAYWSAASAPYIGRTWLDAPWYWAEAYFYRRLLEATGYFQPGPFNMFDPFATTKQPEWQPEVGPARVATLLAALSLEPETRLEQLLHASLWGNRTDLSYMVAAHLGATSTPAEERSNLMVDATAQIVGFISGRENLRVALIADNAGTELLMDLVLADFLLTNELAAQIEIHLKPHPFYVSDATIPDLADATDALIAVGRVAGKLGRRLDAHVAAGDLVPITHQFYTSSGFYFEMPEDLYRDLGRVDLAIVKGDANYRRLVGDAHWPHTSPFDEIVRYFPAPVVALRTFKSELVVGLEEGQAEQVSAEDPNWLVNGQRGVIQAAM